MTLRLSTGELFRLSEDDFIGEVNSMDKDGLRHYLIMARSLIVVLKEKAEIKKKLKITEE